MKAKIRVCDLYHRKGLFHKAVTLAFEILSKYWTYFIRELFLSSFKLEVAILYRYNIIILFKFVRIFE